MWTFQNKKGGGLTPVHTVTLKLEDCLFHYSQPGGREAFKRGSPRHVKEYKYHYY